MKVGSKLGMEIEDTVNVDGDLDILEGSEPIGRTLLRDVTKRLRQIAANNAVWESLVFGRLSCK